MSSNPIRRSSLGSHPEPLSGKKPSASVRELPKGDFVSIHSRAALLDKLEEIANVANQASGADGVAIALQEDSQFLCRASLGFAPEIGVAVEPGQGVCGQCLAESRLVLSQDLPGEIKSALAAPVVVDGKVQGLIAAFSLRPGAFAPSHSDLLCCLASDIAQGLATPDSIQPGGSHSGSGSPHPEPRPASLVERLATLEAIISPVPLDSAPGSESLVLEAATLDSSIASTLEPDETESTKRGIFPFHFLRRPGATDPAALEISENEEGTSIGRPFRNHWDIVVIVAAVLIALLTLGIWIHHRQTQPYTGHLTVQPSTSSSVQFMSRTNLSIFIPGIFSRNFG